MEEKVNSIIKERINRVKRPVITVVVPVYNIEKYLDRCISSVLNQSYKDFELILVDDGCTDKSGIICDYYADKDSRVIVIHKPNGGVSSARNCGIKQAKGKYICFVDSDDWIETTYLQNFMQANPDKYGVVLQSFYYEYENTGESIPQILSNKQIETASELEYLLEYTDGVHNGFLWHRLFHTDIIIDNNLRFPEEITLAEDGIFFLNYIIHTKHYLIIDRPGYHYVIRTNSLTSKAGILKKETYFAMYEGFAKATYNIVEACSPNKEIRNGLKLYMWRLAYSWIIERSLHSKRDYYDYHVFFDSCRKKYGIDAKVYGTSLFYKQILNLYCNSQSNLSYYTLKLMLKVYNLSSLISKRLRK